MRPEVLQLAPEAIGPALEAGRLDLAFGYLPQPTDLHSQPPLKENYVVLLREGHPLRESLSSRDSLAALEFILVQSHIEPAKALLRLGLEGRIRLTIPHFSVVPPQLTATDLAVIMPQRPARRFARQGGLAVVLADLGLPTVTGWACTGSGGCTTTPATAGCARRWSNCWPNAEVRRVATCAVGAAGARRPDESAQENVCLYFRCLACLPSLNR